MQAREFMRAQDLLRGELFGRDRVNTGRLVDAVLRDIGEDAPLDVMAHARRMGVSGPAYIPDGLPRVNVNALASDALPLWKADLDTGDLFARAEAFWKARHGSKDETGNAPHTSVATTRGEVFITGGGWKKYRTFFSPEKLRMVPFIEDILRIAHWGEPQAPKRETHQRQGMTIHPLRAAVEMDGRMYDVALTVREDVNGKLFYDLGAIGFGKQKPGEPSALPDATGIHRGNDSGETRRSLASGQEGASAVPDIIDGHSLNASADAVNLDVRDVTPDFSPEPPPRPSAPPTPEERGILDRAVDYEAERLAREGGATPEELALMERRAADMDTVKREEEAALSVLGCIVGVL